MKKLVSKGIYFSLGIITSDFILYQLMDMKLNDNWIGTSFKLVFLLMFFAWYNRDITAQQDEEIKNLKAELENLKKQDKTRIETEKKLNFFNK